MRALIITGKYAQDIEVFYPLYRMKEEGWDIEIVTEDDQIVAGVYGMKITPNNRLRMISYDIDCLILPGGARALEYIRQNDYVLETIRKIYDLKRVIGSICHGTQLLISAGLVRGRKVSGYYSIKDDIINAGGEFVDGPFITDGRIVCSPHYKYLGPWMKEVIDVTRNRKSI